MSLNTKSFRNTSLQWASITDGDQTNLGFTGDFTFETWIKFNSLFATSNYAGITGKQGSSKAWQIFMYKDGSTTKIRVGHSDGIIAESEFRITWAAATDTWYHLAVVFDTGNTISRVYIDGSQIGTGTIGTETRTSIDDIRFGNFATNFSSTYLMDGWLDETIYWSDVRTSTEIGESYNSGDGKIYAGNEAGMVGYWRYEDDLLDETSNDNDLTNNGSGTFSTDIPFVGGGSVNSNFLQFF